jgi:hypothetical protein
MCNQNIISNKFDLILTTTLSSYKQQWQSAGSSCLASQVSPEGSVHKNRPLSVCPLKKSLCELAIKSWQRQATIFSDCWQSTRDFIPAPWVSTNTLIKYYNHTTQMYLISYT